jgi:hypothetical protein
MEVKIVFLLIIRFKIESIKAYKNELIIMQNLALKLIKLLYYH